MQFLQFLCACVKFIFIGGLLVLFIITPTAAVMMGFGPLLGLVVFALLIGNAYIFGGWGERK